MIKIIKGDILETPADIRVNTVNCVGVMGAGLALAFKNKYPKMFQDYQKDCKAGKVKPGKLHIWKSLFSDWIINFPTKRHWREPSRYEDIDAGLKALHEYLLEQRKGHPNLKVALPAVGCGHGGLDWNRISQMIEEHLSDLEAEIIVFEPSASRNAGIKVDNGEDEKSLEKLQSLGVVIIGPGHEKYPEALRGKSAATFYVKGDMHILRRPVLALIPSSKPSKREVDAATACIEGIAQPGVTLLVGYGPAIERPSIRIALQKGADVALLLSEGIINFRVRRDLQDIWDENRILVLSVAKPNQRWNPSLAFRAKDLQLTIAKAILITDPSPDWLYRLLKNQVPSQLPTMFYVNYNTDDYSTKSIFGSIRAFPVGRSADSGKPNMAPIMECLNIIKAPVSMERDASVTGTYDHEIQVAQRTGQVHEAPAKQTFTEEQRASDGIPRYPKRLIEVDLPIKRISAHARREKSIRHGHISTLHIWWARRPLAACRAVICASLWPDPADELCPHEFREKASQIIIDFAKKATSNKELAKTSDPEIWAKWQTLVKSSDALDPNIPSHMNVLRFSLLDFIADFANWDNSTVKEYLETSRALTQAAHVALGGESGTRPLVVDPFTGGGAIPLESLRIGADAFASDLNPVAVLLNKVILEWITKNGLQLTTEVEKWAKWVKKEAEKELAAFYPKDHDGATPIAYLRARIITCEGPNCGAEVPLIGSIWLSKKPKRFVALEIFPDKKEKRVEFKIVEDGSVQESGTVRRGSATCPVCGYTTPVKAVREQLKKRRGGSTDARLVCVVIKKPGIKGRFYRLPQETDLEAVRKAAQELEVRKVKHEGPESLVPDEPTPEGIGSGAGRAFSQRNYGMIAFSDLYTERQLLTLTTFARIIRNGESFGIPILVKILLGLALGRVNDLSMTLCRWLPSIEAIAAANGGQNRMPVVLDFVESNPFGGSGGDWLGQVKWVTRVVDHITSSDISAGTIIRASAQDSNLPQNSANAYITDPPYYDAFPYSDLSDFFLVWLRRSLGPEILDYSDKLVPKDDEIVVYDVVHGQDGKIKDRTFFEREMTKAFVNGREITKADGIAMIIFANKTTEGWEALLKSIIDAGWFTTATWPIDTERPVRQRAIGSAALGSSVHLVCRPRQVLNGSAHFDKIGDWRDILQALPKRIQEWLPRLAAEGVVGADAIFSCLGPALEIFSQYSSVEKASGQQVTLKEYLEHVWADVAKEALNMIFEGADATGFEEDARLTAMWLWTISTGGNGNGNRNGEGEAMASTGYILEYDAARKIAQGLGAHLERLANLVEIKGNKARLLPVSERTRYLFGKDSSQAPKGKRRKKDKQMKLGFMAALEEAEESGGFDERFAPSEGKTVLDRLHQCMTLFAAGRGEALKRFLVEEGVGRDQRFWRLAQALSALYPPNVDEKRWVDGVLARKKSLGF